MPVFKQQAKPKKGGKAKGLPQEVVDQYKKYIDQLEKGNQGVLEFKKDEKVLLARRALLQAGQESKKYVRVRKPRGATNVLHFERITRNEWVAAHKVAKARGEKLKGKTRVKAKAKKKS